MVVLVNGFLGVSSLPSLAALRICRDSGWFKFLSTMFDKPFVARFRHVKQLVVILQETDHEHVF